MCLRVSVCALHAHYVCEFVCGPAQIFMCVFGRCSWQPEGLWLVAQRQAAVHSGLR